MDGKNNLGGSSNLDFNDHMQRGSQFFTYGNYAGAACFFRQARDASIQILECAMARYRYGLCLLCQVPVPVDDPMLFVPKEVDYYARSALDPFPSSAFRRYTGVMEEKDVKMLEDAKGELLLAWSLVEYRIDDYILKANILSALGEAAFRRGERPNPQRYYFEASSIYERLYGENNKRVADMYPLPVWCRISLTITLCVAVYIKIKCPTCVLIDHILASKFRYVKLLICLEGSDKSKAIEYGKKALLSYDNRIRQLLGEPTGITNKLRQFHRADLEKFVDFPIPTDPSSQLKYPSLQQMNKEANQLLIIVADLENKLELLEPGSFSLPLNQEGNSVTPADQTRETNTVQVNTNLEL